MFIYELLNIAFTIMCVIAVLYLLFRLFVWRQGNEHVVMLMKRRTPFIVEDMSFNQVVLSCEIPFVNKGKQYGTVMDLFPRHLLPQEQFDRVKVESWITDAHKERHDGYWEAVIIKPRKGGVCKLRLVLTAKSGNIRKDLVGFPDMPIDILYQVVGRTDYHISKDRLVLTSSELEQALRQ